MSPSEEVVGLEIRHSTEALASTRDAKKGLLGQQEHFLPRRFRVVRKIRPRRAAKRTDRLTESVTSSCWASAGLPPHSSPVALWRIAVNLKTLKAW